MPSNRYPIPYSEFIFGNFRFSDHMCGQDCSCNKLGCTKHWIYADGKTPNKENMRYILATWQAFRNKPACQNEFLRNFDTIAELVKPLSNMTIFCSWDNQSANVAHIYDKIRAMLSDSVVCTTKTLHFLAPDMFIILDRAQVFPKWKDEMRYHHFSLIKGPIESINGEKYISLMTAVRRKLSYYLENHVSFRLGRRTYPTISTVDQLRYLSPIRTDDQREFPNTITKVLDNIMRESDFEV